jgi:hypothetical protein
MFDIDVANICYLHKIVSELKRVQERNNLNTFYIFQTTNGFHAWNLQKFTLGEAYRIYRQFKYADDTHRFIGYAYRYHWVLRIGNDIKHIEDVITDPNGHILSNAHRLFLNEHYGLNIRHDLYCDNFDEVLLIRYPQRNKNHIKK